MKLRFALAIAAAIGFVICIVLKVQVTHNILVPFPKDTEHFNFGLNLFILVFIGAMIASVVMIKTDPHPKA